MARVRWVAWVGVAVLLATAQGPAADDPFDARLKDAELNERTAPGRAYDPVFKKEFGERYAARLDECAKQVGEPNLTPFDLLLKLTMNGTVDDAMVRPKMPFSQCFMEQCRKATYPKPPSAGYWVVARMRFQQE